MRKSWDNAWLFAEKVGNGGKERNMHTKCQSIELGANRSSGYEVVLLLKKE